MEKVFEAWLTTSAIIIIGGMTSFLIGGLLYALCDYCGIV